MLNSMSDDILKSIQSDINDSDKILIGIGMEWMTDILINRRFFEDERKFLSSEDLIQMKDIVISDDKRKVQMNCYKKMKEILSGKDYFIISLCYDDVIYDVFSDGDRVVTPCGGYRLLQCEKHIMSRDEVVIRNGRPVCPLCGGELNYNNILNEYYMEESYLQKFEEYKGWLQSTINKKLLILEFGTDMKFPQVIRFAFDRLIKFNLKSKMYRVNKQMCMVDASAEGRGLAVEGDSMELVIGL